MIRATPIILATALLIKAAAAQIAPPKTPDNLKAPATETVLIKAVGKGSQIYVCSPKPSDATQFAWALDRPRATLTGTNGAIVAKHYKGPTWQSTDGSKVVGEVQQRAPAPLPTAIPWLLLKATTHEGSGAFARVTYIQRVDTAGGAAPATGCDASHQGEESSIEYQATYFFYGPR